MPGGGGDMAALMAMSRPPVTAEAVDSYTSGQNVNYVRAEEGYEKAYQLFASQGGTALLRTEATELIYGEDGSITDVRTGGRRHGIHHSGQVRHSRGGRLRRQ